MKRKITMITACILSCMLLVCVVFGSYAEMSDETIPDEIDSRIEEEASEEPEEPEEIPDEDPADDDAAVGESAESSDEDSQEDAGAPVTRNDPEPEPETAPAPEPESDPEPASDPASDPEPESEPASEPASDPEPESEPASEPASDPAPESTPDSEPESEPESEPVPNPAPDQESEPESDSSDHSEDPSGEEEPEAAEDGEDGSAEDAEIPQQEPDENGLYEIDDDDHGDIESFAMPEELVTISPEMRFEGITELKIGSEIDGTAVAAPGTYHYIRSGSARTVQLTLYASADIQVQINDQPVRLEAAEDADGNVCAACLVSARAGETFISLIGDSVAYRLKAALPAADEEKAEEETQEGPAASTDEANNEPSDEQAGTEAADGNSDPTDPATDEPEATAGTEDEAEQAENEPETTGEDQAEEADEQDPNRYVVIHSSIEGRKRVYVDTYVKLTAELFGYDENEYTVQWYYSPDQGVTKIPIPGENSLKYVYQINNENLHYIWSVEVTPVDG